MSSVYPSQSELHTSGHTQVYTNRSACLANADRCADSVNKILTQLLHAHMRMPTHTHTHVYMQLFATWEADLTDTSGRSLVAQVLPAAEVVKILHVPT